MDVCIVGPKRSGKSTLFELLTHNSTKFGRDVMVRKSNADVAEKIGIFNTDITLYDTKSKEPYCENDLIPACDGCIIVVSADRHTSIKVSHESYRAPLKYVCEWYLNQCKREDVNVVLLINKLDLLSDTVKHEETLRDIATLTTELISKYECLIYVALVSLHEMQSINAAQNSCAPFFNISQFAN